MFQAALTQQLSEKFGVDGRIPHYYSILYCDTLLAGLQGDFSERKKKGITKTKFRNVLGSVIYNHDSEFKNAVDDLRATGKTPWVKLRKHIVLLFRDLYLAQYKDSDDKLPIDKPIALSETTEELSELINGANNWNEIKIYDVLKFIYIPSNGKNFNPNFGDIQYKTILKEIGAEYKDLINKFCFNADSLDKNIDNWIKGRTSISETMLIELFAALENKYLCFTCDEKGNAYSFNEVLMNISVLRNKLLAGHDGCMLYMRSLKDICFYLTVVKKKTASFYNDSLNALDRAVKDGVYNSLKDYKQPARALNQIAQCFISNVKNGDDGNEKTLAKRTVNFFRGIFGDLTKDESTVIEKRVYWNVSDEVINQIVSEWEKAWKPDMTFNFDNIQEQSIENLYPYVSSAIKNELQTEGYNRIVYKCARNVCDAIILNISTHRISKYIMDGVSAVVTDVIQKEQKDIFIKPDGVFSEPKYLIGDIIKQISIELSNSQSAFRKTLDGCIFDMFKAVFGQSTCDGKIKTIVDVKISNVVRKAVNVWAESDKSNKLNMFNSKLDFFEAYFVQIDGKDKKKIRAFINDIIPMNLIEQQITKWRFCDALNYFKACFVRLKYDEKNAIKKIIGNKLSDKLFEKNMPATKEAEVVADAVDFSDILNCLVENTAFFLSSKLRTKIINDIVNACAQDIYNDVYSAIIKSGYNEMDFASDKFDFKKMPLEIVSVGSQSFFDIVCSATNKSCCNEIDDIMTRSDIGKTRLKAILNDYAHVGKYVELINNYFDAAALGIIQNKQKYNAGFNAGFYTDITNGVADEIAKCDGDLDRIVKLASQSPYFFVMKGHVSIFKEATRRMSYLYSGTDGIVLNVDSSEIEICKKRDNVNNGNNVRQEKNKIDAAQWLRTLIQRTVDVCSFDENFRDILLLQGYSIRNEDGKYKVRFSDKLNSLGKKVLQSSLTDETNKYMTLLRNLFIAYYCESHYYTVALNDLDRELKSIGFLPLYREEDAWEINEFDYFIQKAVEYANTAGEKITEDLVNKTGEKEYCDAVGQFYAACNNS